MGSPCGTLESFLDAQVTVIVSDRPRLWSETDSINRFPSGCGKYVTHMREALGAAFVGLLIAVGGLAAGHSTSAAMQTVGEVLSIGGAIVCVIGCVLAVRDYLERRR